MAESTIFEEIMGDTTPAVDVDTSTDTTPSPDGGNIDTSTPDDTGKGEKEGKAVIDADTGKGGKHVDKKPGDDDGKGKEEPSAGEVTKRLDELEKANKGLLKELGKERGKRQNFEGRLGQVNDFLATTAEKRKAGQEKADLSSQLQDPDYLPVEFDSNDVPRVPTAKIKELFKQQITPIHEEIIQSKRTQAGNQQISDIQAEAGKIISGNEAYPAAMQELEQQWQWINREFTEHVNSGRHAPPKSQDEAEEMIFNAGLEDAFLEQYPGGDFDSVVGAYLLPESVTPKRAGARLRRALKVVAGSSKPAAQGNLQPKPNESLDQANKLAGKSNFANAPNRRQSGQTLTQIAELPMENLLALKDHEAEQLYDLMEE